MWVLWYWSKFLSFEEKATFVISCQTFWGYLPNLVATEDDASQPLNLKSFFRIVFVKFVVFFFNCTLCFSDFYSGWLPWKFLHLQNPEVYQGSISVSLASRVLEPTNTLRPHMGRTSLWGMQAIMISVYTLWRAAAFLIYLQLIGGYHKFWWIYSNTSTIT